jgi:hypothetical protein
MDTKNYTDYSEFVTVPKINTLQPQRRPMATKTPLIVLKAKHLAKRMQTRKLSSVGVK